MTDLNAVLDMVPVADIASKLGIPEDVASAAVKQVLPGLVGGLAANASSAEGSASLHKALGKHVDGTTDVAKIDTDDGAKIVKNVFGGNTDQVASKLAENEPKPNVTADIIKQVLPIVAPIVLSYIASQMFKPAAAKPAAGSAKSAGESAGQSAGAGAAKSAGGFDLGGMLGGLLSDPKTQSMVGGLLGGLLGGGKK